MKQRLENSATFGRTSSIVEGIYEGIPVIAITAFAMKGDEEKALDAGCAGYITKPIDTRGFLETIAQYLK